MFRVDDGSDLALAENKYRVQIYANGDIIWIPGLKFRTSCKVDLTRFPFDSQTCYINITSWLYTMEYVHFNVTAGGVLLDHLEPNGEWDMVTTNESSDTIDSVAGTMSYVYCVVELRRRSQYYVLHILMPVIAMSSVSMFVFAMPVQSGEKISLGISVLISYSVFTLLVTDIMPANADAMPVLSKYSNRRPAIFPQVLEGHCCALPGAHLFRSVLRDPWHLASKAFNTILTNENDYSYALFARTFKIR